MIDLSGHDVQSAEPESAQLACHYCEVERTTPDAQWLYRDALWSAGGHPLVDEPGWVIAMLRRHVEAIGQLTDAELHSLGLVAARLSEAITSVTAAEKVYVMIFLEANHHFHLLLAPRPPGAPRELRGPNLILNRQQFKDPAAAVEVGDRIRAHIAETSTSWEGAHA
jgi:diadenosine tetraphosphate (Ap4A) HIT family hydrolase